MHGHTYVVDVLRRLARLGLGRWRGAALRQQHRARAALHIVRRKDRLRAYHVIEVYVPLSFPVGWCVKCVSAQLVQPACACVKLPARDSRKKNHTPKQPRC